MRVVFILAGGALALLSAIVPGMAQAPETVGVSSAVLPDTRGTLPGGAGHVLQIGHDVYRDELVRTDRNGRAQVLFLDGTRFSIFPDDEVVLNRYRFDPRRRTGKLEATLRSGAMRATAGAIGKEPGDIAVSLGSTGTSASLRQDAVAILDAPTDGTASVINLSGKEGGPGSVIITTADGRYSTVPPGMRQSVNPDGSLGSLERSRPGEVDAMMRRLEGGQGTGQRAGEGNLQAIRRGNSALASDQLLFGQSVRSLDVRDLDILAGLTTGRLGDLAQRRFIGELPPLPPPGVPDVVVIPPPAGPIVISTDSGSATIASTVTPPGGNVPVPVLTPNATITQPAGSAGVRVVPGGPQSVVVRVNSGSQVRLGEQILRQGIYVLQGVNASPSLR